MNGNRRRNGSGTGAVPLPAPAGPLPVAAPLAPPGWGAIARIAAVVTAVALLLVFGGGSLAWAFERDEPGSNLRSLGDCLWWALTTLTTVGYGDHFPVSPAGRVVAAGIMIGGVAILGGVAASIALVVTQRLFARAAQMEEEVADVEEELAESMRETESLEQLLRELLDRVSGLEEQVRGLRDDRHHGGDGHRGSGQEGAGPAGAGPGAAASTD